MHKRKEPSATDIRKQPNFRTADQEMQEEGKFNVGCGWSLASTRTKIMNYVTQKGSEPGNVVGKGYDCALAVIAKMSGIYPLVVCIC